MVWRKQTLSKAVKAMIYFPNAKLNLGLNIVSKRPDGYHNLETIFYPIPIEDALEVSPSKQFAFKQAGISIDGDVEKNLVVRALRAFETRVHVPPLEVNLLKAIPFGAGLGGGSADAAFMLRLLNDYLEAGLSSDVLEELAGTIGADCPFFIQNKPVFATGIGNVFHPLDSFSLAGYHLCLVKPPVAVSTAEAYAMVKPSTPAMPLTAIIQKPIETWRKWMVNDFEKSVFPQHPLIEEVKQKLYDAGALYASMSGSGSSVYGIFKEQTALKAAFPKDFFVWEGALER